MKILANREATSAIGKAYQMGGKPIWDNKNAAGSKTTNCLSTETIKLLTPCPTAWNSVENKIPSAAGRKLKLIIRRAGTPIPNMFSEALKIKSNWSGTAQNKIIPQAIMTRAITLPIFRADTNRSLLRAP